MPRLKTLRENPPVTQPMLTTVQTPTGRGCSRTATHTRIISLSARRIYLGEVRTPIHCLAQTHNVA